MIRFGSELQIAADLIKRRGGQPLEFVDKPAWHFRLFVELAYRAVLSAGGELSVNRNNIEEGRLPKFIEFFRPHLPPKFVPDELSPASLADIKKEVDSPYRQAT